jgi:hypothetical protein
MADAKRAAFSFGIAALSLTAELPGMHEIVSRGF